MATIAKGMITLVNVNDAYSVSATPNVCAIKADFDGTNPVLDEAYCDITVVRGDTKVPFTVQSSTPSNSGIQYTITGTDAVKRLAITSIPSDVLSGTVTVEVATEDEYVATVIFQYSVMRESTMLDWIKDWENNKTTIGSTYLITPKIFVGKKVTSEADLSLLTGVYIGPDSDNGAGIYGYKEGVEIFHINETGGAIGGWEINNGGIQTSDGLLKILSEGSIIANDSDANLVWGIYKSGAAKFAKGNVLFNADGSAYFSGKISSTQGAIGGWNITDNALYSNHILFDSKSHYIGISPFSIDSYDNAVATLHKAALSTYGGVGLFYTNASSYGIVGYLPAITAGDVTNTQKTFSLGSENKIASWYFDTDSLWIGTKLNTAQQYTSDTNSITFGTAGLRGYKWYIDTNGDISFMGGKIKFTASDDGGEIVGWKLNSNRLSTNNVALVSDGSVTGLYMSANSDANFNSLASSSLEDYIDENGGIYMNISDTGAEFAAYDQNGKKLFKLKSDDVSSIAGWSFDKTNLYVGTAYYTDFTPDEYSITLSPKGLFGYKWKLLVDGSGALAGGNISWDSNGNVVFSDTVSLSWTKGIDEAKTAASNAQSTANSANTTANDAQQKAEGVVTTYANLMGTYLTHIGSDGIYTGTLCADNITSGTISTANIKNVEGTWYLNQDGSGALAGGAIQWTSEGVLTVKNSNLNNVIVSGSIKTPFVDGYSVLDSNGIVSISTYGIQNNNCVVIPGTDSSWKTAFTVPFTSAYNGFRVIILNYDWNGAQSKGQISASAPDGFYFYEDGEPMSELVINTCEMVEMIGIGEGDTFKGWLVLKRCLYLYNNGISIGEGFEMRAMYFGKVQFSDGTPSLVRQKRWNRNISSNTDSLYISYPTSGNKIVTVHFPSGLFSSADKYEVLLTGVNDSNANVFACVTEKTADSFAVYTGDDNSFNAGGFTFIVLGTWFWS